MSENSAASPAGTIVLVRHVSRNPRTRTLRAARAGHRRQGVILDNGQRVRFKGRQRMTEVDLRTLVDSHEKFLEYVRVGTLEVVDGATGNLVSFADLVSAIEGMAQAMRKNVKIDESLFATPDGSNEMNAAPDAGAEAKPAAKMPAAPPPPPPEQTDEESEEEESTEESELEEPESEEDEEEEEVLDEAELKKLKREELDTMAVEAGLDPSDYSTKGEVIAALMGQE